MNIASYQPRIPLTLASLALSLLMGNVDASLKAATPLSPSFTYQGKLTDGNQPANGVYDFVFSLYDAADGQVPIAGGGIGVEDVTVHDGLFSVSLNFGENVFNGESRWIEIGVRPGSETGDFSLMQTRQPLSAAPHALYALASKSAQTVAPGGIGVAQIAAGAVTGDKIAGAQVVKSVNGLRDAVSLVPGSNISITPEGNGLKISASNSAPAAWRLDGNTNAAGSFLGTRDALPLELRVNNTRALMVSSTAETPNWVGGASYNGTLPGVMGAFIGGGGRVGQANNANGDYSAIGGGYGNAAVFGAYVGGGSQNLAGGDRAVVSGGLQNEATDSETIIGGGYQNKASGYRASILGGFLNEASGRWTFIGAGGQNKAAADLSTVVGGNLNQAIGVGSFVGGGSVNISSAEGATIGGGKNNRVDALQSGILGGLSNEVLKDSVQSSIVGGYNNTIETNTFQCVISGGNSNYVGTVSSQSAIGGGRENIIRNNAFQATIAGGFQNYVNDNARRASIGGGAQNLVVGSYGVVPGGLGGVALSYGQLAHASGQFLQKGDAQSGEYVLRCQTVGTNETEMFLDGAGERIQLPVDSVMAFNVQIVASTRGPSAAGYELKGLVQNRDGNMAFIGTPAKTILGESATGFDARVTNTFGISALQIKVKGINLGNSDNVKWVAVVRTSEVVNHN